MAGSDRGAQQLVDFLRASHLTVPDDVPMLILKHARGMGAHDAALYLVDYEQRILVPVPMPGGRSRDEVVIDSTLAGRCYRTLDIQETAVEAGRIRTWVPVLDGCRAAGSAGARVGSA